MVLRSDSWKIFFRGDNSLKEVSLADKSSFYYGTGIWLAAVG